MFKTDDNHEGGRQRHQTTLELFCERLPAELPRASPTQAAALWQTIRDHFPKLTDKPYGVEATAHALNARAGTIDLRLRLDIPDLTKETGTVSEIPAATAVPLLGPNLLHRWLTLEIARRLNYGPTSDIAPLVALLGDTIPVPATPDEQIRLADAIPAAAEAVAAAETRRYRQRLDAAMHAATVDRRRGGTYLRAHNAASDSDAGRPYSVHPSTIETADLIDAMLEQQQLHDAARLADLAPGDVDITILDDGPSTAPQRARDTFCVTTGRRAWQAPISIRETGDHTDTPRVLGVDDVAPFMHPYSLHTRLSTMLRECVSTPDGAEVIGRLLRTLARWMPMPVIGSNGTTVDRRPAPLPPYVRDHHAEAADAYDRAAERGLCIALRQHAHGRRLSERRPESELMSLQD